MCFRVCFVFFFVFDCFFGSIVECFVFFGCRTHMVGECEMYREERDVLEMRNIAERGKEKSVH